MRARAVFAALVLASGLRPPAPRAAVDGRLASSPAVRVAGVAFAVQHKLRNKVRAVAIVSVVDQSGRPVEGALVRAAWRFKGKVLNPCEGVADANGRARLYSSWTRAKGSDRFALTPIEVSKEGYAFVSSTGGR